MKIVHLTLSLFPAALQAVLVVIFLHRHLYRWRELPFFFIYTVYSIVAEISRDIAVKYGNVYSITYWSTEAIFDILEILVVWSVFRSIFIAEYEDHWWFRVFLPATALLVAALCLQQATWHPLNQGISPLCSGTYWFDLGVHAFGGGIFVLYIAIRKVMSGPETQYEHGILLGFAVAACFSMAGFLARFEFGASSEMYFRYGPPVGYLLATLLWLRFFWHPPAPHLPLNTEILKAASRRMDEETDSLKKGDWCQ